MLTNWLIQQGKRVAVLSRGYRRQSVEPVVMVSDGRGVLAGPAEAGDEPYLIATRCPGAIVAVGSDRHHVGQQVLDRFAVDCFLLDDGFQHVALQRDVDLLLVDLSDRSGLDGLFPVGRLREPLGSAARATCLVLTRVQGPAEWKSQIDRIMDAWGRPRQPVLVRFTGEQVVDQLDGTVSPIGSLAGTPLLAFSGIANPASFRDLLSEAGLNVVCERVFPDHHAYSAEDVERLLRLARESGAGRLLTTEKDAGKVATLFPAGSSPLALRLGIEILQGRTELESLILGKVDRGRAVAIA